MIGLSHTCRSLGGRAELSQPRNPRFFLSMSSGYMARFIFSGRAACTSHGVLGSDTGRAGLAVEPCAHFDGETMYAFASARVSATEAARSRWVRRHGK